METWLSIWINLTLWKFQSRTVKIEPTVREVLKRNQASPTESKPCLFSDHYTRNLKTFWEMRSLFDHLTDNLSWTGKVFYHESALQIRSNTISEGVHKLRNNGVRFIMGKIELCLNIHIETAFSNLVLENCRESIQLLSLALSVTQVY